MLKLLVESFSCDLDAVDRAARRALAVAHRHQWMRIRTSQLFAQNKGPILESESSR